MEHMGFSFEECERLARGMSDWKMIVYGEREAENVSWN